jgi:hypothetical protein
LLVVAVLAAMVALVLWGPEVHRPTIGAALIGLIGTLVAAIRGRLVKRDPSAFKDGAS